MNLDYNALIQRVADKLEAAPGRHGLDELDLSLVVRAVESLEDEGYALEYIADRDDMVAKRMNQS